LVIGFFVCSLRKFYTQALAFSIVDVPWRSSAQAQPDELMPERLEGVPVASGAHGEQAKIYRAQMLGFHPVPE
jgi:hypothetical protein